MSCFSCVICLLYIFLYIVSFQIFCPYFHWLLCLTKLLEFIIYFEYRFFKLNICPTNIFSSLFSCLFIFLTIFWKAKGFNFDENQFIIFFSLMVDAFYVSSKKYLPNPKSQRFLSCIFLSIIIVLAIRLSWMIHFRFIFLCTVS